MEKTTCPESGCTSPTRNGGRCTAHRQAKPARPRSLDGPTAICPNCSLPDLRKRFLKGLCSACYQYQRKHGVPRPQEIYERPILKAAGKWRCRTCGEVKDRTDGFHANQYDCKACQIGLATAWRERHPGRLRADQRDPEVAARYRAVMKAYRESPAGRAKRQARARVDRERSQERMRFDPEYRKRRAAIMKQVKLNRRKRYRAAFVEKVDLEYLRKRDKGRCGICRKSIPLGQESIDHIVPLAEGGTHEHANVQLAHRRCNSRKWIKSSPKGDQLMLLG